ncbi:MAG: TIGR04086 family membrane protein [Huintestinicola sp.]
MRKSSSSAAARERLAALLTAILAGIGALTAASVILSGFALFLDLSDSAVSTLSGIALAAGCFACASAAANRRRRHGLATGFVCGLTVFTAVLIIGSLTVKTFTAGGVVIKLIIILTSSALGGIRGVNTRTFAHYR